MKEIKQTMNYNLFKKLEGNRSVDISRINKIKKSIQKVGYVTSPILVNENMEIIDGQGRFEALKSLHLPIEYIKHDGIGINECVAMNIYQTNWSSKDYIRSYAERGVKSYELLNDLINKYPQFNLHVFCTLLTKNGRFDDSMLKSGELIITEEQYQQSLKILDELKIYLPYQNRIHKFSTFIQAIIHCYSFDEVDKEKLYRQVSSAIEAYNFIPFSTIEECMRSIEEAYNRRRKSAYVYILTLYRQMIEKKQYEIRRVYFYNNKNTEIQEEAI